MSSRTLSRLGGISLLIGSLSFIIGVIPGIFTGNNQASTIGTAGAVICLIGAILIVLGLPSMYASFAGRVGIVGLIGFTCTLLMFLIGMASESILAFIFPFLAVHGLLGGGRPPLGLLILYSVDDLLGLIGGILLGIAILRVAILPRGAGVVLIIGGVLYALGSVLRLPIGDAGLILFAASLAWLAAGILSKQAVTGEAVHPLTGMRA